jgi:hypothetical protein
MRVVVGVLGLLLVPAVRSSTRKLYPSLVVIGWSIHRGEVAARAFLILSAITVFPHISSTYMLRVVSALLDIGAGRICKLTVPNQVLSTMQPPPVPVSSHHRTDELGVILARSGTCCEAASSDFMSWSSNRSGRNKSN